MTTAFTDNVNYIASLDHVYGKSATIYKSNMSLSSIIPYDAETTVDIYNMNTATTQSIVTTGAVSTLTLDAHLAAVQTNILAAFPTATVTHSYVVNITSGNIDIGTFNLRIDVPTGDLYIVKAEIKITTFANPVYYLTADIASPLRLLPRIAMLSQVAISSLNYLYTNSDKIILVADNMASITTVGASIADVNTVSTNIASVNTTATNIANVNTVGANIANVNSVAADLTNINAIIADITNIDAVATNLAAINQANANAVLVAADLLLTNADVVSTHADVVLTHADVALTHADVILTHADVTSTNADVIAANLAKVAAQMSETNANALYADFNTKYLGAKISDPLVDNVGNPLIVGAIYWNSVSEQLFFWSGTAWLSDYVTATSSTTFTNKMIDSITNYIGANHVHYPVRNVSGATIPKGTVVTGFSTQSGTDYIEVMPVSDPQAQIALGILHIDVANNGTGLAINTGVCIDMVNTSLWAVGTLLYPNNTGGLTDVKPTFGRYQACAVVTRSHANQGTLLVEFTEPKYIGSTTVAGYLQLEDSLISTSAALALTAAQGKILNDTKQPLDADLTAIAALVGTTGFLKKTAADTWTLDTNSYITSVTGTAPVVSSGGTAPAISIPAATALVDGYMTAIYASKLDGIAAGATANLGTVTEVTGDSIISVATGTTTPALTHSIADGFLHVPATGTTNNGKVLTAGATAGSFSWQTPSSGFSDPMTTRGDMIIRDATNTTARLPVGTSGQVLGTNGIDIIWTTSPAGVTDHTLLTNIGVNTHAQIDTALTRLANTSGTNTGDQDLSGYSLTTHNHTVDSLSNVVITANSDNEVLAWDTTTSKWINQTATEAGLATASHDHAGVYQPLDADLTAIAALVGTTGLLKKTAADTWALDTTAYGTGTVTKVTGDSIISVATGTTTPALTHSVADGFLHVPATSTTNNGKVLTAGATAGSLSWTTPTATDITKLPLAGGTMTGAITAIRETKVAMAANDIDLATGNLFTKTISGATTLTISNALASGNSNSFVLELTNGGSAAITWFAGVKWASGVPPTLTASGVDILGFYSHDGGTTWRGIVMAKDSK